MIAGGIALAAGCVHWLFFTDGPAPPRIIAIEAEDDLLLTADQSAELDRRVRDFVESANWRRFWPGPWQRRRYIMIDAQERRWAIYAPDALYLDSCCWIGESAKLGSVLRFLEDLESDRSQAR